MILRSLVAMLCALVLCAADYPPPPAALQPYIADGQLDPGDYGWMKGRFDDATPQEREAFRAISLWTSQCRESALADVRDRLLALGHAAPRVDSVILGPLVCQQAMFQPQLPDYGSYAAFQRELAVARPAADAFLTAIAMASEISASRQADFARQLVTRRIADQAVRSAMLLGDQPGAPHLTPAGTAIFRSRINAAAAAYDHANTEWLKAYVAEHGWPKVSEVGEEAAGTAWLLVQHADADPLFQLHVLDLMEPLAAQGEVSKQNYAYLYDRVMLKLSGKQRYASQMTCADGKYQPLPLEDEAAVERLRAEMGMDTLAEYTARMQQTTSHLPHGCGT